MAIIDKIKQQAKTLHGEIVELRRQLHMHPELSFHEQRTSATLKAQLEQAGITKYKNMAGTGIVALIEGKNPGKKTVALRADMDALPITETNDVPYKSQNEGVMHACGHDVHSSCLLGAARILQGLRDEFEGTVKLIFQPGEEKLPGGASLMIGEGVLKDPAPQAVIGQHVMPLIEAGKVGYRSGVYMASTDELYLTVHGKGGHGALPHLTVDPVLIASHLVVALQQVVSRNANPIMPSVLSFGKVVADGATNVIPDRVRLEGTFRTLDENWRNRAHEKIRSIAEGVCAAMGAKCELEIRKGYPVLINEPALTARVKTAMEEYMGPANVVPLDIWMAAEDFAFYSHEADACFYRLGTRNEKKGITSSVHTSTFDVEESALETGMGLMAFLAVKQLGG
jgi:amidohydrolase